MLRPANKIAQPRQDIVFRASDFSMSGRVPLTILLRPTFGLFVLILLMSVAQSGAAQGVKFTSPVTYPAGHPYVVASGDFNGDGKTDLVAGDVTNNNLVMLLGNGDGTLKAPITYHLDAAPYYIIANDFNRDGKLDLAIGFSYPGKVGILFGKGDGSFEPPANYAVPGAHLLAADFNNDGKPDLVMPNANNSLTVLLNNGNGTFQSTKSYAFPLKYLRVFAAGDFNLDGRMDLAGLSRNENSIDPRVVSVLLGNGDGTFRPRIDTTGTNLGDGSGPYSIVVGDFDRDGKTDIVVADESVTFLKGNGDGTFKPPSAQPHVSTSVDLKVADFNGDGKVDLVSSGVFSGGFTVLLGNGDGTFQNVGVLASGMTSVSVVAVDLNGDTRPDLAGNTAGQLAVALLNVTPGNVSNTDYFVHQHYLDFLDREPDAFGYNFWSNQITSCGADQACIDSKRINVSSAFYLSIEFQQTAGLVEHLYKIAYGDTNGVSTIGGTHQVLVPIVRLNEFLPDTQQIGQDVVVGQAGWDTVLENNKQSFVAQFVQRPRFTTAFPITLTPAEFVDKLNLNAGNVLSANERAAAIGLFGNAMDTSNTSARGQALRQIAENHKLYDSEFNRAFVLMEYFGYLRRNPNEGQDTDFSGYDFWLQKLNQFSGDFQKSEMVKAFITSGEYRTRFGP